MVERPSASRGLRSRCRWCSVWPRALQSQLRTPGACAQRWAVSGGFQCFLASYERVQSSDCSAWCQVPCIIRSPPPLSTTAVIVTITLGGACLSVAFRPVWSLSDNHMEVGFLSCLRVCISKQASPSVAAPQSAHRQPDPASCRVQHSLCIRRQQLVARELRGAFHSRPLHASNAQTRCSPPQHPLRIPPTPRLTGPSAERKEEGDVLSMQENLEREEALLGQVFNYQWQDTDSQ